MTESTYTTTTLEALELAWAANIGPELAEYFAEPARFSARASLIAEQVWMEIRQRVWGEELESVELPSPADWWQAVKDRWFPKWAKHRWPVQYLTYVVKLQALYPKRCFPLDESYPKISAQRMTEYGLVAEDGFHA